MEISVSTLRRLPEYLNYLKNLPNEVVNISATSIAAGLNYGDVQVRKDLGAVSGSGRPKVGYNRLELIKTLENYLGYHNRKKAIIIGAGKLGEALMGYRGFCDYGLDIVAAFDIRNVGSQVSDKKVYSIEVLEKFCHLEKIRIGIITVPAVAAQEVAEKMYKSGIKIIWNFAPIHLNLPDDVLVHDENMAASLALLTKQFETMFD
ncbi:MAG: redox-sensing transcriptional repressor Rex [Ruminococcus sp.]|nr:redox-sensing transcriptional repressor Rex [Ruminococcus sp.]